MFYLLFLRFLENKQNIFQMKPPLVILRSLEAVTTLIDLPYKSRVSRKFVGVDKDEVKPRISKPKPIVIGFSITKTDGNRFPHYCQV